MKGVVVKSTGSWYLVKSMDGKLFQCRLRGKFKLKGLKVTNPIAVGDQVEFEEEHDTQEASGLITDIYPRENYIIRKSTHKSSQAHLLAANIDQAVLLVTLVFPRTSLGFIDRFLVSAESFRIPALLLFNKKDLLDDDLMEEQQKYMEQYESIGYQCLLISAHDPEDLKLVRSYLEGKISLLTGHSGSGKSTLLNGLDENINQKVNPVSTYANKGVHTTTFAEMFSLDSETHVIDTPGIKELGLVAIDEEELSHYFPEMRALLGQCKFHNCTHTHEPGCAIKEALEINQINAARYYSYLSMLENEDNRR